MGLHPRYGKPTLCFFIVFSFSLVAASIGCGGSSGPTLVSKTITSIAVTPNPASIAVGATQQLTATATYSDSSTANISTAVTWTSSAASVATVNSSGMASAVATGSATITATLTGVSGSTALTVTAAPVTISSIAVTPATQSITAGATQQFTATATYSDGTTGNVTSTAAWTSSASSTATINTAGLATAVAAGSTTITASLNGVSGTAALTVTAAVTIPVSIAVTPTAPSIGAGSTQQFTATATYSNGSTANVTSGATWTSSSTTVATINASGLATGVAAGSTTMTASVGGVSGATTLTVTAGTPTSIAVTPNPASFSVGSTQQFTATATYSGGSTANITSSVTWSSSNTSVATIDASGLATGAASGSTTITATLNAVSGSSAATIAIASTTGVNITTWHVDNNRDGLNSSEHSLTPSNVTSSTFGKLFSYLTDGYAYAEPLILSNVTIGGATHNVLYMATENDSVYAFDADTYGTGAPLWKVSLLQSAETPISGADIGPVLGITSTPVIDPSTNTLYIVSAETSSAAGGTFRLHALDIATGAEKFGGPVQIQATVPGTGEGGTTESLTTSCIQRSALTLANGNIYIGFGGCHAGWFLAYSASTLQQVGAFNSSPILDGEGAYASAGGVWMGSGGAVVDSSGNVYITTGNGPWNGTNAFGDSVLRFLPTPTSGANGTMQPSDYFTPSIYQYMDCNDADLAAGGLMLVPGTTTLIAGGKTGTMFLVNSTSLGHESANDAGAIQEQVWGDGLTNGGTYTSNPCQDANGQSYTANITSYEIFGTSAYFNNDVYLGVTPTASVAPGGVRQFEYSGTLTPFADTTPPLEQGTRGTSPFISSNGTSNGIVWMIDEGNPLQNTNGAAPSSAILRAFSADSYPNELYDSTQNSADTAGYGIKFTSPVVANGKVYISTGHDLTTVSSPQGEIDVYGLK
jgi:uncharacterized protein YjdB